MKKFSLLAAAFAMVMAFTSCSNGSDDSPVVLPPASATFEAGATYKSADNGFDGNQTITVKMTSATAGTINNGGEDKSFTIDSTTGALTYTGNNGDTSVSHILKAGEKIYAAGRPSVTTSASLTTTWDCGEGRTVTFTADKVTYNGETAAYTIENGIIKATIDGGQRKMLFAGSKLFFKYAELTKQ